MIRLAQMLLIDDCEGCLYELLLLASSQATVSLLL